MDQQRTAGAWSRRVKMLILNMKKLAKFIGKKRSQTSIRSRYRVPPNGTGRLWICDAVFNRPLYHWHKDDALLIWTHMTIKEAEKPASARLRLSAVDDSSSSSSVFNLRSRLENIITWEGDSPVVDSGTEMEIRTIIFMIKPHAILRGRLKQRTRVLRVLWWRDFKRQWHGKKMRVVFCPSGRVNGNQSMNGGRLWLFQKAEVQLRISTGYTNIFIAHWFWKRCFGHTSNSRWCGKHFLGGSKV